MRRDRLKRLEEKVRSGTAKGGIVIAIAQELQVPVKFVGLGEDIKDMQPFDAEEYVNALI